MLFVCDFDFVCGFDLEWVLAFFFVDFIRTVC